MRHFTKPYQLWLPVEIDTQYAPYEFDTFQAALTADRLDQGDNWYITQELTDQMLETLLRKEMAGHPELRQDPLGKLPHMYQLWNGTVGRYQLTTYNRLLDALKAPRLAEDWYLTQAA